MNSRITVSEDEYIGKGLELLKKLISYKSVMGAPEEDAPYGKECAQCLSFAADTLRNDGFFVKEFDGHAVTAAFDERPCELGILCHLDVVPTEGQDWKSDPFKAEVREDRLYGRGAIDDKGPAAAVITAMRMIKDSKVKLRKNVRLILGSNEENGSEDMKYYREREPFPPMLFTPDGDFPLITIEKGMIRFEISGGYGSSLISLKAGSVINAVPEFAEAVISITAPAIPPFNAEGVTFETAMDGEYTKISVKGKGAHASTPSQGANALTALLCILSRLPLDDKTHALMESMTEIFPYGEYDGSAAGVKCSDERSGGLTLVLSLAENGTFKADCRFPAGITSDGIISVLSEKCRERGLSLKAILTSEPHCADENSEMVKTLLNVYEDITGEKGECLAIGGGTYVHDTENGVAFGAQWSEENNMHGANEFIGLDEFKKDIEIYCEAILRLCE